MFVWVPGLPYELLNAIDLEHDRPPVKEIPQTRTLETDRESCPAPEDVEAS